MSLLRYINKIIQVVPRIENNSTNLYLLERREDMVGLIRKDMYCLKKNLKVFLCVTIGIMVLSVLFIISSKCGNVARGMEQMKREQKFSSETVISIYQCVIWLTLFIIIAFIGMIIECFKEDRKAGFRKQLLSMPISSYKIVCSRYISCMLFSVVSVCAALISAMCVSIPTDMFSFAKLASCVISFASILLIYMSIVMCLIYLVGSEYADIIQCVPVILLLIGLMIKFQGSIQKISDAQFEKLFRGIMKDLSYFMTNKWYLLLGIAIACMGISYVISCIFFNDRRGDLKC